MFSWLICESYDGKGNAVVYRYARENDDGIDLTRTSERDRTRSANRYLKRVQYGNRRPLLIDPTRPSFRAPHVPPPDLDDAGWMFEVVFDYGQQHYGDEQADDEGRVWAECTAAPRSDAGWAVRRDAFFTYRAGFEVRTYRLCRRALMAADSARVAILRDGRAPEHAPSSG